MKIAGYHHGYFSEEEKNSIFKKIEESGASLLLVAFGAPKQDIWIQKNIASMKLKVAMGVGGLFDFYSGNIPRAPLWMREMGLEWLYRLYQEPWRLWKRYVIGNPIFIYRVLKEKFLGK